jgi:phosphoribosyl 1,2-cyclic phosphate phosphodiesterase
MKVEFLGTGGAITTPRPACNCEVCIEAKEKGVPYSRSGPSMFIHGLNFLIDTPEEIKDQLNRSKVEVIEGGLYSHWHPDHVMGRRVWETLNADFRNWPPKEQQTDIYLPEQVAEDFKKWLGTWDHFQFMESKGWIKIHKLKDGEVIEKNGYTITPFRLAEDYVYAFIIEGEGKRVLIVADELNNWEPSKEIAALEFDTVILPAGVCEFHPLSGERKISSNHPVLKVEATFEDTLNVIKKLKTKRTILTHFEEIDQLSFDDHKEIGRSISNKGIGKIEFAYDTLVVEI